MKIRFDRSIFFKLLFISLLVSLFEFLYFKDAIIASGLGCESMLISTLGGVIISKGEITSDFFFSFLIYYIPCILILILFFNSYIANDFKINAIYIFTRKNNKFMWLLSRAIEILMYVMFYFGTCLTLIFILCIANRVTLENTKYIFYIIIFELILLSLNSFLFLLIGNFLSIKFGIKNGLLVNFSINILLFFIAILFKMNLLILFINPISHGNLIWHSNDFLKEYNNMLFDNVVSYQTVEISVIYFLILITLIFLIGYRLISKLELIDFEKEFL